MGIGRERGIHVLALCQDRRLVQNEIELTIRFSHREGQRQDFSRRHGKEVVSIHRLLYGVNSVIADESTVRPAGSQRLKTRITVRALNHFAFGIEILDKGLDIRVSLIDDKGEAAVPGEVMMF